MRTNDLITANTYEPVAVYYRDADYVEYVREDVPCVQRRVDEYLTLSLDMFSRDLVGFRIKGFRNLYLQHFRETQAVLDDAHFLRLMSVLEKTVELIGHSVFKHDEKRQEAYKAAYSLAKRDNVELAETECIAA